MGNGLVIDPVEVEMAPGQKDEIALRGGYGITYQTNSKSDVPSSPEFFAGLVEDDSAYNFAAAAVGSRTA